MEMESILFTNQKDIKKDITKLYLDAFPENERPPVHYFYNSLRKENNKLYAFYENSEFVGFTYLSHYKDIVYIFFLAVSPNKRNQGYGSKILQFIKDENKDKVILLCYEEVDDKYEDNLLRIKRKEFYARNGFQYNGIKTNEFGVIFETAFIGPHPVSYEDYVEIFVIGFGKLARKFIKRQK